MTHRPISLVTLGGPRRNKSLSPSGSDGPVIHLKLDERRQKPLAERALTAKR